MPRFGKQHEDEAPTADEAAPEAATDEAGTTEPATDSEPATGDEAAPVAAFTFTAEPDPEPPTTWVVRSPKPNPLEAQYRESLASITGDVTHGTAFRMTLPTAELVKEAGKLLRRAARENEAGIQITSSEVADGHRVVFRAVPKRKHAYTTDQVRAWAKTAGLTVPDKGKPPASVVDAYRAANGLPARKG